MSLSASAEQRPNISYACGYRKYCEIIVLVISIDGRVSVKKPRDNGKLQIMRNQKSIITQNECRVWWLSAISVVERDTQQVQAMAGLYSV